MRRRKVHARRALPGAKQPRRSLDFSRCVSTSIRRKVKRKRAGARGSGENTDNARQRCAGGCSDLRRVAAAAGKKCPSLPGSDSPRVQCHTCVLASRRPDDRGCEINFQIQTARPVLERPALASLSRRGNGTTWESASRETIGEYVTEEFVANSMEGFGI